MQKYFNRLNIFVLINMGKKLDSCFSKVNFLSSIFKMGHNKFIQSREF